MASDTRLLLAAAGAVVVLVLLIVRLKLSAFIALMVASLLAGLLAGLDLLATAKAFQAGMGAVLGSIAAIIGLGTVLGKMLVESGGSEVIAETIVRKAGARHLPWAMLLIALIVGAPVFFAVGLVLLAPILFALVRQHQSNMLLLGIPMVAGLSAMHGLVPPHPGPMAAIQMMGADTGRTIWYALMVGIPAAIIAGPLFGRWISRRLPKGGVETSILARKEARTARPGFGMTLFTVLLPIGLMLVGTVAEIAFDAESRWRTRVAFLADPVVALLIGVLFSFYSFGAALGLDRQALLKFSEDCLGPVAIILLIVGAGGGFSRVLIESGVGEAVSRIATAWEIRPLWLAYGAACLIRVATGSATVAITTAAALVKPVADAYPGTNLELVVLAMGAGSLILSHVNDGGFWLVKEYLNLSVPETLKTWTVMETLLSVVSFGLVLLLGLSGEKPG